MGWRELPRTENQEQSLPDEHAVRHVDAPLRRGHSICVHHSPLASPRTSPSPRHDRPTATAEICQKSAGFPPDPSRARHRARRSPPKSDGFLTDFRRLRSNDAEAARPTRKSGRNPPDFSHSQLQKAGARSDRRRILAVFRRISAYCSASFDRFLKITTIPLNMSCVGLFRRLPNEG